GKVALPSYPLSPLFYPEWEILPHEARLPHVDVISERLQTLVALEAWPSAAHLPCPIINTSVVALLQRTFPPDQLRRRTRALRQGEHLNPLDLIEWLEEQGYEPEVRVSKKGDLSLRGGIVDVFPLTSPWPVRLEFFGDELDALRYCDPVSQRAREQIPGISLPPAGELGFLKRENQSAEPRGGSEDTWATLVDYLPRETVLLFCEPARLEASAAKYAGQVPPHDPFFIPWEKLQARARANGLAMLEVEEEPRVEVGGPTPESESGGSAAVNPDASLTSIELGHIEKTASSPPALSFKEGEGETDHRPFVRSMAVAPLPPLPSLGSSFCTLSFSTLDAFRPVAERAPEAHVLEAQRLEFFGQIHRWLRQDYSVHVFCNNDGERRRFGEIWDEYGLDKNDPASSRSPAAGAAQSGLHTHLGTLARGFLVEEAKIVVVTDAEIFGRYKVQRPRRLKSSHAVALRSALDIDFTELEEGDYVVHFQHGIGRYAGLQAMPGQGRREGQAEEESLVIEYASREPGQPAPRLYVPVTEAHLISKYVGAGRGRPPLNTLGGTRWARTKAQTGRAVRDVAGEMLAIQAARATQPGHAFAADTPWQREFESAFIFEETPDQWRAIADTKADMEQPKPMDRLICGDVGFGKTEVAIRAAFKAVMDGRQVAVLVPTTVLAQQHFNTLRERMADYPVRIELLSRFRTRRAQEKVIAELAAGAVDIVVGTHRLVQNDVTFKELGLVVIDEEQRFGVLHKEKFKTLRRLVDVLTLSATPIPRTLYLALLGARDMSTIQTPPHDRLPVETIVTPYDERTIREAILRELGRGGQVFFLHNRVMTIQVVADKLRELVPDARLVVGHGQMHSDDLEEVMTQFVNGEADILLSTTIIESGLDIPNANTIIIDRADRFGLSDLYQLRGRVGRYKHQAYAYLLIPTHARLLTDARKRISALKQYSTLGSGYRIAMRDLEIRGAGNLLGA
ncbi:MAG: transcription-repair coupling factor, partial [Verrucomicrobia bacterium]|nr:transcription-repair coupling factor [Verrucomicrobiota bacterium]